MISYIFNPPSLLVGSKGYDLFVPRYSIKLTKPMVPTVKIEQIVHTYFVVEDLPRILLYFQFTVIQRYHFCLNLSARSAHLANSLPEWNFRLECNTLNGKSLMRKANGLNPVLIADYPNLIWKSPIITRRSMKKFQMWNLSLAPLAALA